MVSKLIRRIRCEDLLTLFLKDGKSCVFFTLTTPDVVDYLEIRRRWRGVRHFLVERMGKGCKFVMNYELHPKGHGWHVHSVWNRFIDLRRCLPKIQSFGFGRVDVRRVYKRGVADYLTKHALKAYRGVSKKEGSDTRLRLVNCSRGLPRLSDYRVQSDFKDSVSRFYEQCMAFNYPQFNKLPFSMRWKVSELAVLLGCHFPSMVAERCIDFLNGDLNVGSEYTVSVA